MTSFKLYAVVDTETGKVISKCNGAYIKKINNLRVNITDYDSHERNGIDNALVRICNLSTTKGNIEKTESLELSSWINELSDGEYLLLVDNVDHIRSIIELN